MIRDANVPVSCDKCYVEIQITPPFVYGSLSGSDGRYDTKDETIVALLPPVGWAEIDGKHYCDGCAEDMREA